MGPPGPYPAGHVSLLVTDAERADRPLAIGIWYPASGDAITAASPPATYPVKPFAAAGPSSTSTDWEALGYDRVVEGVPLGAGAPFPLVVFSPGGGAAGTLYVGLAARLASYGYVTAVLDHCQDGALGDVSMPLQMRMLDRPLDISFAVSLILEASATAGQFHGSIDPARVAVGGHSLGGYAALALAGGDDLVCDSAYASSADGGTIADACVATLPDARVTAVFSLEGASQYLRWDELARVAVPSLFMGAPVAYHADWRPAAASAASLRSASPGSAAWDTFVARPHAATQRSDSYRVDVHRTNHISFTNACDAIGIGLRLGLSFPPADLADLQGQCSGVLSSAEDMQVMTRYLVAFLDAHLLGSSAAATTLTEADAAGRTPAVEFLASEACPVSLPDDTYFAYRPLQASGCGIARKDPSEFFTPAP